MPGRFEVSLGEEYEYWSCLQRRLMKKFYQINCCISNPFWCTRINAIDYLNYYPFIHSLYHQLELRFTFQFVKIWWVNFQMRQHLRILLPVPLSVISDPYNNSTQILQFVHSSSTFEKISLARQIKIQEPLSSVFMTDLVLIQS